MSYVWPEILWVIDLRVGKEEGHWASIVASFSTAANPHLFYFYSRQPWSAYAVHLTTLSPPALLGDLLLVWLCHKATAPWGQTLHDQAMTALYMWMFTSKWIKLLGHYIRYPVDVFLLPVSILFGYFHGAIKMYAVMTLNVVSSILFTSLLFHMFSSLASQWRKSGRGAKVVGVLAGCGLPKRSPLSSYDSPASQRFDHSSSFVQPRPYPLLFLSSPCELFYVFVIHTNL